MRAQRSMGSIYSMMLLCGHKKAATGKSLISLKTIPSPKICFTSLFIQLLRFFSLPFSKSQKFSKNVQFLIVYKIFHFNIQLAAKTERKPKPACKVLSYEFGFKKFAKIFFNPPESLYAMNQQRFPYRKKQDSCSRSARPL